MAHLSEPSACAFAAGVPDPISLMRVMPSSSSISKPSPKPSSAVRRSSSVRTSALLAAVALAFARPSKKL